MPANIRRQSRKPSDNRTQATTNADDHRQVDTEPLASLGKRMWLFSAFLFGAALCWSFLQPNDSVAVFQGQSLPQVLAWLAIGTLTATAAWLTGNVLHVGRWHWLIAIVLLMWQIAVTIAAGQGVNPRTAWLGFWQMAALASCYYSSLALLSGVKERSVAIVLCLVGCLGSAALGAHQVMIDMPAMRLAYEENPDDVLRKSQVDAPPGSVLRQQFEDRLRSPEPFAAFSLANSLAVVLSAGLILSLGSLVMSWRNTGWLSRGAMLFSCGLIGVIWFMTLSRTAYLAVAVGLAIWGLGTWMTSADRRSTVRWLSAGASAAVVIMGLGLAWLSVNDRLVLSEAPKSLAFRLEYWWATLNMSADFGWRGVGLGNFQDYYPTYMLATASETIADPHNWFLDIAVCLSIPTAMVCAIWLGKVCLTGLQFRPLKEVPSQDVVSDERSKGLHSPNATLGHSSSGKWMLIGGALGGSLCLGMLILLSGYAPQAYVIAICVAVALASLHYRAFAMLAECGQELLRAVVVTMIVCLLASGSWQASGIAVPLLVMIACLQRLVAKRKSESVDVTPQVLRSRGSVDLRTAAAAVLLPLLGSLCFIVQCWLPVTQSWAQLAMASSARSLDEQLESAQALLEADPLNVESYEFVCSLLVAQAKTAQGERFLREANVAIDQLDYWLERDGISQLNWKFAGDRALELAGQAQQQGLESMPFLLKAADYYQGSVVRYPTSVARHMQLAVLKAALNEYPNALAEVSEATRLSEITSHSDKKIAAQQLWLPIVVPGLEDIPDIRVGQFVKAEPVADWIRKSNQPSSP